MTHPLATYRLQLTEQQPFAHAAAQVPYLADLGISHLYLSPLLQARPGSSHLYDVADHARVSEALGGEDDLRALADTAHQAGLGLIGDLVPNHMGAGHWSPLWDALLRDGRSSEAARFFDVDWDTWLPGGEGKVILPVLADPYGDALAAGDFGIIAADDGHRITYGDLSFPVNRDSETALARAGTDGLVGVPGKPRTWTRMHAMLEQQHYRLVSTRAGTRLVNYRRFLDVNEMPALRVESDQVFDATHETMIRLVHEGVLDGLRIDHVDGLVDPTAYLTRLRDQVGPDAWIVVEALADAQAGLPEQWPVDGTTGYEVLRTTLGLHVDPVGLGLMRQLAVHHDAAPNSTELHRIKAEVLDGNLGPDLRRVARAFWTACQDEPAVRDVDYRTLLEALAALAASLQRHRTYVDPEDGSASDVDVDVVNAAVERARSALDRDDVPDRLWDHLQAMLNGEVRWTVAVGEAVIRFQQLTGSLVGIGVEQRWFGRHQVLIAACELGCDPEDVPRTLARAHAEITSWPATGMRTTATHDTLLGEDVRQRIVALTGFADEWIMLVDALLADAPSASLGLRLLQAAVGIWPVTDDGSPAITEVLDDGLRARLADHAITWARRQSVDTSHRAPDAAVEAAMRGWASRLLDPAGEAALRLRPFAVRAGSVGMAASLSQALVRLTVPGIPDTYQGTEWWDDSLTDPDNRRPVDLPARRATLASLAAPDAPDAAELWQARRDGRIKQHVIATALRVRRELPDVMGPHGTYTPVVARGRWTNHMHAYARRTGQAERTSTGSTVVVVAPRVFGRVTDGGRYEPTGRIWADTDLVLPGQARWTDQLTGQTVEGGTIAVAELLRTLPVALLVTEG